MGLLCGVRCRRRAYLKILQKPFKILPKTFQFEVWREPGAALWRVFALRRQWAASWTPLGQLLGSSSRILGTSRVALGSSWAPSWGVQERLEGILEASWGKFEAQMERS